MNSELNPNVIVVSIVTMLLGALWNRIRGKKDQQIDVTDALWNALKGYVIKLAESDFVIDTVRTKLTTAAEEALVRMKVPRNAITDLVVAKLVERGISEVRERILERKQLEAKIAAQLGTVAAKAGGVLDAFTPKGTLPKLGEGLEGEFVVEVVKP